MAEEEILFDGPISFRAMHFSHGLIWMLLLGWNIGLLLSYNASIMWKLKITTERIVSIKGFIGQAAEEVEYFRVVDSKFEQTFLQRLFSVGTITLYSSDRSTPQLTFPCVRPRELRERIRDCVRIQRQHMRTVRGDFDFGFE
jgi:membrane protein YdbS with pleckstrin-like domain